MFRTKARAPSLIVCEVVREDLHSTMFQNVDPGSPEGCDNSFEGIRRADSKNSAFDSVDEGDGKGKRSPRSPRKSLKRSQKQNNSNNNSSGSIIINSIGNNVNEDDGGQGKDESTDNNNKNSVEGISHLVDSSLATYRLKSTSPESNNRQSPSSQTRSSSQPDFYMSSANRIGENHTNKANSPKSKAFNTPVLTTRKMFDGHLFDGNECCGFSMSRALSADDLRIKDGESSPISPVFKRNGDELDEECDVGETERGGVRGREKAYIGDDDAINDNNNGKRNDNVNKITSSSSSGNSALRKTTHATHLNHSNEKSGKIESSFNTPSSSTTSTSTASGCDTAQKLCRKNISSSLLSANRKSIFNFQTMLKSASTDDFSLLTRGEIPSNIFEKTVRLTRNNNHSTKSQSSQGSAHSNNDNPKNMKNSSSNNTGADGNHGNKIDNGSNLNKNSNNDGIKSLNTPGTSRLLPPPFSPTPSTPTPSSPVPKKEIIETNLVENMEKLSLVRTKNTSERAGGHMVRYSGTTPLPLFLPDDIDCKLLKKSEGDLRTSTGIENSSGNDESYVCPKVDGNDDVSVTNNQSEMNGDLMNDGSSSIHGKKDRADPSSCRSSSSSPPFHSTHLSTESVFRLGDQLALKNVTIQACRKLFFENRIVKDEYEKLIRTEISFLEEKTRSEAVAATLRLKNIFGESWSDKKNRILSSSHENSSMNERNEKSVNNDDCCDRNIIECDSDSESDDEDDYWPSNDVISFIVKSNDDLRQEVCCLQIMQICNEIFNDYNLRTQLYLKPYRIVSTGSNTGLVQVLTDTLSLDALKKTPGFVNLPHYYKKTFGTSAERLSAAKRNFASSLAAYSLFCYILQIKDRHNGNLLIDQEGHIIHIDFGFLLSIAPGHFFFLFFSSFFFSFFPLLLLYHLIFSGIFSFLSIFSITTMLVS